MTLRCKPDQVAIYVPPIGLSGLALDPDAAIACCRRFLDALRSNAGGAARVYDDRAATVEYESDLFGSPCASGTMPAADRLEDDARALRVVIIAERAGDPRQLARPGVQRLGRADPALEVYQAASCLVDVPSPARLEQLAAADAAAWQPFFDVFLAFPFVATCKVGPPPPLLSALLARHSLDQWIEIAERASTAVVAASASRSRAREQPRHQALRHLGNWLRSATAPSVVDPHDPDAVRAALERNLDLAIGGWDLPASVIATLRRAGLVTARDLVQRTEHDLHDLGIDRSHLSAIRFLLSNLGHELSRPPEDRSALLATPLLDWGELSIHAVRALAKGDITTVGQLATCSDQQLATTGLGPKALREVTGVLADLRARLA